MILPPNRFGLFNSFFDQIFHIKRQSKFDVNFESDTNVLFTAVGLNAGRYIVTRFFL